VNHSEIVSFLWGVADLIRDTFKRGKYQDVILPLTVLRRLDCVLAPKKAKVLEIQAKFTGKLDNLDPQLRRASGFAFYNTSRYDFDKLLADAPHLAANLRNYIAGFSPNMREVLEKFDFDNTIRLLDEAGLLFQVMERFKNVNLHPDKVDNPTMGTIFEELIRKFNEALNENPGEHFTPRDVVHLMVDLLLAGDEARIRGEGAIRTVYDPCCGSGGMLTITKDHISGTDSRPGINPKADIHLFGQEVNPETWAVSKSDLLILHPDGHDADNILFGSTLSNDCHAAREFDYQIIDRDGFESGDKFMLHLSHVVQSGLGDRAGTCIDPKLQLVEGKTVCLVSCQRSPEPVFLKWKGSEKHQDGDFFVRSGPGTVKLSPESAQKYIQTRFHQAEKQVGKSE
jgi:type I restriction enzyme M protein